MYNYILQHNQNFFTYYVLVIKFDTKHNFDVNMKCTNKFAVTYAKFILFIMLWSRQNLLPNINSLLIGNTQSKFIVFEKSLILKLSI